jgi:phosphoadenosine phosphosulfate reductase
MSLREHTRQWNEQVQGKSAADLIRFAADRVDGPIALGCSFGAEDVALVHMVTQLEREVDIFYLDTNLHFQKTYETRDRLAQRYGCRFIQVLPALTLKEQAEQYGNSLWLRNPDACCRLRKVEPLRWILGKYKAWITGVRREQSPTRANTDLIEWDPVFELVKINPLAYWNSEHVWRYIRQHDIPYNPLHDQYYPSIGCVPCTRPVKPGEDPRSGRWSGFSKTECGLHLRADTVKSKK